MERKSSRMTDDRPAGLHIWDGADSYALHPHCLDQYILLETYRSTDRKAAHLEPFTPEWFARLEQKRYSRHGAWLPRLLEFGKHPGEHVVGIGCGVGTDWCRYAAAGARVTVCHPHKEHLDVLRKNFHSRELDATLLHSPFERWPLGESSADVVTICGPLPPEVDHAALAEEAFRVLKPGGKVLAVLPAHHDVTWWLTRLVPWHTWVSQVSIRDVIRPENRFTSRDVRRLFASFEVARVRRRHLRRWELPHLWRCLPLLILERLIGRFHVVKAFKPLSCALPTEVRPSAA